MADNRRARSAARSPKKRGQKLSSGPSLRALWTHDLARRLADAVGLGVSLIGPEFKVLAVNKALRTKLPPRSRLTVCFRTFADPPREAPCDDCPIRLTFKDGQVHESVVSCLAGGNSRVTSSPIRSARGTIIAALETIENLAGEERIEEERFGRAFEHAAVGIIQLAPDGRILAVNRKFCDIVGYSKEDLRGRTIQDLTHPDDAEAEMVWISRALAGEIPDYAVDKRLFRRDGALVWIHLTSSLIRHADGRPESFIAVFEDITDQRRAHAALSTALAEKEVLLRDVQHRVQNNMQLISSLLNLQAGLVSNPAVLEAIRASQNRIRSISLIHERLDRSEAKGSVDLYAYLRDIVGGITASSGTGRARVVVEWDLEKIEAPLKPAVSLGLIVNELLSNAFKHAFPDGRSGTVRLSLGKNADGGLLLSVDDDGVGLPVGLDPRSGSSLGLRIVGLLVDELGGRLDIMSGAGTSLKIFLDPREWKEGVLKP